MSNPLLSPWQLPPFARIQPEHIVPAVEHTLQNHLKALAAQLEQLGPPSWDTLIGPLEAREDALEQLWAPISHLNSVANTPALREAYQQAQQQLTDYYTQLGQSTPLFEAYKTLANSSAFSQLNPAQQRAITLALQGFELAGVALPAEHKQRFAQLRTDLSSLCTHFANQVLDATLGWFYHTTDACELAGLPAFMHTQAAQVAAQKGLQGYVLSLDGPVYLTVMTQADNRALRQTFYEAYNTRASDQGPCAGQWDNTRVINDILEKRLEMAQLLGFSSYSDYSLATKMAPSPEAVVRFLTDLADQCRPMAQQEWANLQAWVAQEHGLDSLQVWDIPYYSEKYKQAFFSVSQEALRPYFPLPKVLEGLFSTLNRLFNIHISPAEAPDLWHKDAHFYHITRNNQVIAGFYVDLYAREGKKGGAWMAQCRVRRQTPNGLQTPIAFLVCNFSAPVDNTPSLLTHQEVTTLFHEFGHGIHHLLTRMDVAAVSGINGVEWDAVELPSQFMENFCWQPEVLHTISGHVDTGQALPEADIKRLLGAQHFQSALQMLRQIEFALFDMRLHSEFGQPGFSGVRQVLNSVRKQVAVIHPPAFNRFETSFSHIFAGGYAAGYYSYKWAEVLSADAFAAFEETGLFNAHTGNAFLQHILEAGGSASALTLFTRFRGRPPEIKALLRHSGIAQ